MVREAGQAALVPAATHILGGDIRGLPLSLHAKVYIGIRMG